MAGMDLMPLNKEGFAIVQAVEGKNFSELMAREFFMMTVDNKGNPHITIKKAGILYKANQIFGAGKYIIQPFVPDRETISTIRQMNGVKDGQIFVLMGAKLFLHGNTEPFIEYATATPVNCRNGRYQEMAQTRAIVRVLKIATGCGFASEEEIIEQLSTEEIRIERKVEAPPKAGDEAKAYKDSFYAKFREAHGSSDSKLVLSYVQQTIGKDPRKDKPTIEEYEIMIRNLQAQIDKAKEPEAEEAVIIEDELVLE